MPTDLLSLQVAKCVALCKKQCLCGDFKPHLSGATGRTPGKCLFPADLFSPGMSLLSAM